MNEAAAGTKVATIEHLRSKQPAHDPQAPVVRQSFFDLQGFELMQRAAKLLAASSLIPKDFQGNLANCVIAMNMAQRMGADPLMICQNLYVVYGRPGWSAQFLIATFNHCGRFSAVRYEWLGEKGKDTWGCRAYATEKETGEKIIGPDVSIKLSKDEGWYDKSGSKWKTIPQLMLMYRAAAWMIRSHAPEIAMGLQTVEELGDTFDASRGPDGGYQVTTESLRAAGEIAGEAKPADPAPDQKPAADLAGNVTYAQVADAINAAASPDAIEAASALITSIGADAQRAELDVAARAKRKQINAALDKAAGQ